MVKLTDTQPYIAFREKGKRATHPDDTLSFFQRLADDSAQSTNHNEVKGYNMNELFEITADGKTTYGFKLAMNSENKLVMEEKSTGKILVVSIDSVKEVLPYTISVSTFSGDAVRNYTIEPGKLQVNDLVISYSLTDAKVGRMIGIVSAVDTKVKGAPQFSGSRLMSEKIA